MAQLRSLGPTSDILIQFDTGSGRYSGRERGIDVDKHSLFAEMICYCNLEDTVVGYAKVWRSDSREVSRAPSRSAW